MENPLPERAVTANQVVAWNLARYRRAGWTQGEFGAAIGWSEDKVSDAERSWHSGRTREFDAQTLTVMAVALGIPVVGLLLPPGSDGHEEVLEIPLPGGRVLDMADYMAEAVMPDSDSETFAADAYRTRYTAAAERYLDSGWAEAGKRWAGAVSAPQAAVDRAAWVRDKQRQVAELAAGLAEFADGIEKGKGE